MKREEFFEALSDIDENMVAAAKQNEEVSAPVIVTPKKSYVKPICTAAACAALAAAITVAAVSVSRRPSSVISPNTQNQDYKTSITVISTSSYPDVTYPYTGDYSNLEIKYLCDEFPAFYSESKFKNYEELAEYSSLIVMGTFIDDTNQVTDNNDVPDFAKALFSSYSFNTYASFNTLKVEKVLKSNGQVWEGDEIAITQPYVIADGGMYSFSQLTPMIKGDKWIYFLNRYNSSCPEEICGKGAYYPVNDYEGRYPVPDNENAPFQYRENTKGVVAPAVFNEGVYSELKDKLTAAVEEKRPPYEIESQKVTSIARELGLDQSCPADASIEIEMGEFEGVIFGINTGNYSLYIRTAKSSEISPIIGNIAERVEFCAAYLCDLNGDGKREICAGFSVGLNNIFNAILALDYANDKLYILSDFGKSGNFEHDYFLQERNGELEYLKTPPAWSSNPNNETGTLTLDIMTEYVSDDDPSSEPEPSSEKVFKIMDLKDGYSDYLTEMPLVFDMEEFPDISFERDPTGDFSDALYLKEGEKSRRLLSCARINSIYLCDLNEDGNREICAAIDVSAWDYRIGAGVICPSIAVIDYANNNSYLLFTQEKNEERNCDYTLKAMNDILFLERIDPQTGASMSSESLTLDIFEREGRVIHDDIEIIIITDE